MNKTRYKIATLTGSAVMAAMLLSLLILNIVFNKKIELRAENAIKNVFTLDSDEYLNYESENDTGSLYYASLVYMGADSENRDDIYQILTPKEKKLIDWYETHPFDEMQRAKINEATYYMKARTVLVFCWMLLSLPLSVLPLDIFSGKNLNKMTKLRRPFLKIHLTN